MQEDPAEKTRQPKPLWSHVGSSCLAFICSKDWPARPHMLPVLAPPPYLQRASGRAPCRVW
jgi:hypothetical protein